VPDPIYTELALLMQLVLLLLIPLEAALAAKRRINAEYDLQDTLANVGVSVGSIFFWGTLGWMYFGGVLYAYHHRLYDIPFTWWSFSIAFVLEDCRYYWWHRISHRSRWFWASHVVHHSSQHFNLSTNLRQSWTSQFSGLTLLGMPLAFIGFNPALVALAFTLNLIYQFWIHTEAVDRMPRWFEWLLNTPSHHRVHHATNPGYLDANYAGVFMVWDRLFGSFVAERKDDPPRYGIVHNLGSFNPLRIAIHEYYAIARDVLRRDATWVQRFAYFFGPPGWSHDGSRATTAQLRALAALHGRRPATPALSS
jgi:sterol desaturase/sphingolipid hydroxylase (fatty acid hydroxylase superfamily)